MTPRLIVSIRNSSTRIWIVIELNGTGFLSQSVRLITSLAARTQCCGNSPKSLPSIRLKINSNSSTFRSLLNTPFRKVSHERDHSTGKPTDAKIIERVNEDERDRHRNLLGIPEHQMADCGSTIALHFQVKPGESSTQTPIGSSIRNRPTVNFAFAIILLPLEVLLCVPR